jgi:outer membrane protein insertion porin family
MDGRGFTTFLSYQLRRSFARIGLSYSFSTNTIHPATTAANTYFDYVNFLGLNGSGPNQLSGIRTSMITPSWSYNTVNHPITPTHGLRANLSFGVSGSVLGGNVNTFQPGVDVAYFRRGIFKSNVMGFHFNGRVIAGYGGKGVPPYARFYMGGETDVRGFDIYTISPFGYIPTEGTITQYHQLPAGANLSTAVPITDPATGANLTVNVPSYQLVFPGGDTYAVFNYEYRIPIFGPVTLAPFLDAGVDRLSFPNQLALNPGRVAQLNTEFGSTNLFTDRVLLAPGTQKPRVSTGLELQVLMPVVNAPFRLYWAYNLSYLNTNLYPPVAGIPLWMAVNDTTRQIAAATLGQAIPWQERRSLFRFSVGRTF